MSDIAACPLDQHFPICLRWDNDCITVIGHAGRSWSAVAAVTLLCNRSRNYRTILLRSIIVSWTDGRMNGRWMSHQLFGRVMITGEIVLALNVPAPKLPSTYFPKCPFPKMSFFRNISFPKCYKAVHFLPIRIKPLFRCIFERNAYSAVYRYVPNKSLSRFSPKENPAAFKQERIN